MYQIGDLVVYCGQGVCRVDAMQERVVDRKTVTYLVLMPLEHGQTQFYVPVHNPAAMAKLRYLLTRQELTQLLRSAKIQEDCWVVEESRRKLRYKELANSNDFASIIQMVNTLLHHRQLQLSAGKKFHLCDDNFLRDAKKILEAEISIILEVPVPQAWQAVQELLKE